MKIAILGLQEFKSDNLLDKNFKHLKSLFYGLADRGHELVIFGDSHEQHLFHHPRIQFIPVPATLNNVRLGLFYARNIRSVDVIHTVSLRHAWVLPILSTFFKEVPQIVDIRQFSFANTTEGKAKAQSLVTLVKTHADQIIVPFESVKRYIFSNQGRFTHTIHDGLNFDEKKPAKTTLPKSLQNQEFILLDLTNSTNSKLVIKTLAKYNSKTPIICIGQNLSEETIDLIKKASNFYVVSSAQSQEIQALTAYAKLYIHTQKNPEYTHLIHTALKYQTPVVGPEMASLREIFERNYLAYTPTNFSSILNTIRFALDQPEILKNMAKRSYLQAEETLLLEGSINRVIYIWANAYRNKELQKAVQTVDMLSKI